MSTSHTAPLEKPRALVPNPGVRYRSRPARKRRLRAGIVELLGVAAAVALAFLVPQIHVGFDVPANGAIEMLVAAGAGTVTSIGVVFSLPVPGGAVRLDDVLGAAQLFRDAPIVSRAFAYYMAVVAYSFTAVLVIGREEET